MHRLFTRLLPLLFLLFLSEKTPAQDVILQGFYWNTHPGDVTNTTTGGIWWDTLTTVASQLGSNGAGFNAIWTPPPTKSFAGVWDMGYGTYDYFDLGSFVDKGTTRTRHGNRAQMNSMLSAYHSNGMKVMCDVVLNHRGGSPTQAPYEYGGGQGYIIFNPASSRIPTTAANARWFHPNNLHHDLNDYTIAYFFEDVCHFTDNDANPPRNSAGNAPSSWFFGTPPANPGIGAMGDSMIMWGRWLINDVGFDQLRLDAVKHVEPDFIAKWLVETKNGDQPFAVGEFFDANATTLRNYWNAVQTSSNTGGVKPAKISMFDFNLRDALKSVLNNGSGSSDLYQTLGTAGLVWDTDMGGYDAVTWLDNHDTDRYGYEGDSPGCSIPYGASCLKLAYSSGHDPIVQDKEDMGYPFILAAEGRPTVFWKDWYWYGLSKDIKWEMALRAATATGTSNSIVDLAGFWPTSAPYDGDNHGGNMFALRRNGLTGGVSDGMVLGLNDDDDKEHAVYVNTPFTSKYLKDYSDGYLFQTSQAFADSRALIKAQKRDYSWWSLTGLYPKPPGTAASHFTMNATPGGCPHFIAICVADASNLIVNGAPIAAGDEVAVKNAAGQVVGIGRVGQGFQWDGSHDMIIEALGSPSSNGLAANEAFRVFVYDASANATVQIGTVQYAASGSSFTFAPERGNSPNRNGNFSTFSVTTTATGLFTCEGISRIIAFNTSVGATQQFCAGDNAGNSTYNSSWGNGSNGGNGLGAWSLSSTGNAGFFTASSTNNGNGDNNADGDINTSGRAWGLYANGGGQSNAVRPFVSDLVAGSVFTLKMDNGFIDNGNTVGFGLQNSSGNNLLEFYFTGGSSFYIYNDLSGTHNTSVGFSDEGLSLQITMTSATAYSLVVTPLGGGGSSTYTGSLKSPTGGQSVNRVRLFNANAGSNSDHDAYFNSIGVCYPATLVINEVDYDQPTADNLEFIELKNVSSATVNLANYQLQLWDGGTNSIYQTVSLSNVNLAAGGYYVICGSGSGVAHCNQSFSGSADQIQDGAPDAVRLVLNTSLAVDALSYEGSVSGAVEGTGTTAADNATTAGLGLSRLPDGDDNNTNNADFELSCSTPGTANVVNTDTDGDAIPNACDPCPLAVSAIPNFNPATCNCNPGYYPVTQVMGGQTVIVGCSPCPAGSYCPDGLAAIPCPAGKYSDVTGSVTCISCAAGSYNGLTGQTSCTLCPPGKYSDVTGATACTNCAAGSFNGQSGQTSCTLCPPGKYSDVQGATACTNCAAGSFNGQSGQTSCTLCPPGKYSDVQGATACTNCAAGSFNGQSGQTSCTLCPPGKYSDITGATACTNCAAGSFNGQSGQTSCTLCPPGKYSDVQGATACTNCAAGSFNGQSGQTSCTLCPPGKYSDITGATACTNCAAGSFNGQSGQTACTLCPPGKYSDVAGATECTNCAPGSYNGQSGQTNCTLCPPGQYSSSSGSTACNNCATNTYSSNSGSTACDNCGDGFYSPPGSSACSMCSITFTATPTPASCGSNNGQIAISGVSGGTAPIQYSMDGGMSYSGTATFTGLAMGTYQVRVKDAYNCETASMPVMVGSAPCTLDFSGRVKWVDNPALGVNNATVSLTGAGTGSDITDAAGDYLISIPHTTGNFILKGAKNINRLNGVDASDVSRIQQHIVGNNPFTSPYKLIAADVNRNNSVTTQDASILQQAILGNPAALAIFNVFWRFVNESVTLSMPPWPQLPAAEQISLTGVSSNQTNKNFTGIKIGDVTSPAADPALFPQNTNPLVWKVQDRNLLEGQEVSATFRAGQFEGLAAYQFALRFDTALLAFSNLTTTAAIPLSAGNFGLFHLDEGLIRTTWAANNDYSVPIDTAVFTVQFDVLQSGGLLSEALKIDTTDIQAIAYNSIFESQSVSMEYTSAPVTTTTPATQGLSLQARPNPFSDRTTIGFVLPQAGEVQLRVFDAAGRLLAESRCDCAAGYHEEEFDLGKVPAGMLFGELVTPFGVRALKLVRQ